MKDETLEEIQRKLADLELREKLDNLEHEFYNRQCNCPPQHEQADCHYLPVSHHIPSRYCDYGCGKAWCDHPDRHQPENSYPEPSDHGRSDLDCGSKGRCKCHPTLPTELHDPQCHCGKLGDRQTTPPNSCSHREPKEPRGIPRSPQPTDDEYRRSTPNGHKFSFHHRRYRSYSRQRHSTKSSRRDHSLASSLDIYSANVTRHPSLHATGPGDKEMDTPNKQPPFAPTGRDSRQSPSRGYYPHARGGGSEEDIPRRPYSPRRSDHDEDTLSDRYIRVQLASSRRRRRKPKSSWKQQERKHFKEKSMNCF
ncbi:hypothetical protein BKA65DRAFT_477988 [Rhexocercosporidium sp. MPI-PUGE-AT-0058]|nr:hypothetical protein BKA65DRAFT_477988 [Rhexocercosporidium sp. MPI-PUGE-AT-0058]